MIFYIQFFINQNIQFDFTLPSINEYITINSDGTIIFNAKSLLQSNDIRSGIFKYKIFIILNTPIILKLYIKKISKNKTELQLLYDRADLRNISILLNDIISQSTNNEYVILGSLFANIITNLKLYSLKDVLYIKTLETNKTQVLTSLSIYKLKYTPFLDYVLLTYLSVDDNNINEYINIAEPNFYLIDVYNGSQIKQKNLNNIYYNTSSNISGNIILSYLNSSPLLIDYSTVSNFVYYGGAISRLDAFVNKLLSIYTEFVNVSYSSNKSYSNYYYLKILNTYKSRLNLIFISFDGYLQYLFNSYPKAYINTSSLQTFLIIIEEPSQSNTNFINWYSPIYSRSLEFLLYSGSNRLYNTIPAFIREDTANLEYIKFIDMIGSYFDIIKLDLDGLSAINSKKLLLLINLNTQILNSILNNYDLEVIKNYNYLLLESVYLQYLGIFNTSVHDLTFTYLKYNKLLWSKFISNIYFLLKSRGTKLCIYNILNIFGINKNIISVKLFTGYNNDNYILNVHTVLNTSLIDLDIYMYNVNLSKNHVILLDFYYTYTGISSNILTMLNVNDYISIVYDNTSLLLYSILKYDLNITQSGHYNLTIASEYIKLFYIETSSISIIYTQSGVMLNTSEIEFVLYSASVPNLIQFNTIRVISESDLSNIYQYVEYYNYINVNGEILTKMYYDFTSPLFYNNGTIYNRLTTKEDDSFYYNAANKIYEYIESRMVYYNPLFNLSMCDSNYVTIASKSTQPVTLSFYTTLSEWASPTILQNNKIFIGMDSAHLSDQLTLRFFGDYKILNMINIHGLQSLNEYKTLNQYEKYYYGNVRTNTFDVNSQVNLLLHFDNSAFKVIKSFLPSNGAAYVGLFVRNPILHRNKVLSPTDLDIFVPMLESCVDMNYTNIQSSNNLILTSLDIDNILDVVYTTELPYIANIQYELYEQPIVGDTIQPFIQTDYYKYLLDKNLYFTDRAYTIPLYYDHDILTLQIITENILYDMYNYRDSIINIGLQTQLSVIYVSSSLLRKLLIDGQKKLKITTI